MSKYNTITFENNKIIIIIDNNNIIWFNAKQICNALKYKQPKMAIINNVEKDDKIQLKHIKINFKVQQQPDSIYIKESGQYQIDYIDWKEISRTPDGNFFLVDTSWFIPNDYFIEIKIESGNEVRTAPTVIPFTIISEETLC